MVHAALLLLMLEAVTTDLVFTISLKRSTQNLQLSTSSPADYPISADRDWNVSANDRLNFIGFRLGRTLSVDGAITVAPGGP
jgi:hypothetical protein